MEPIHPDIIAQIATKLFQQGPHSEGAAISPLGSHASPTALPSTLPAAFPASVPNSTPTPPSGFPSEAAGASVPHSPSFPVHPGAVPSQPSIPNSAPFSPSSVPSIGNVPMIGSLPAALINAASQGPGARSAAPTSSHAPTGIGSGMGSGGVSSSDEGLRRFIAEVRRPGSQQQAGRFGNTGALAPNGLGNTLSPHGAAFDVQGIRKDFPVLHQEVNGHPLAWLDNAATTQKPQTVIDAISHFYATDNSNIHRAAHSLAARATEAYESSRKTVATFLGANSEKDIVFVRGTTEGINFVANTYGRRYLKSGDEIILSTLEHHANIVPWQMIAKRRGATIRVVPVNDNGEIILDEYMRMLSTKTKLVALSHASNSLGTILPVAEMAHMAKRYGARVLIDGAQSVSHMNVNVNQLGCDFYVFSGHKLFAPTGIGAVYVKEELHDLLPPWQGGGNMIRNVTFEKTTYAEAPAKFEAGTPNIADAVGLKAAIEYVTAIGLPRIAAHEHELLHHATTELSRIPGLRIIGSAKEKVSVISFVLDGYETEAIGKRLDQHGIAVRSGHHCAQPSLRRFGLETTVRPSFSIYNTHEEVVRLVDVIRQMARR